MLQTRGVRLAGAAAWAGVAAVLGIAGVGLFAARPPGSWSGTTAPAQVGAPPPARGLGVTALGRLEPRNGLTRIAGPSDVTVVIAELRVDEGDRVQAGQVVAQLDTFAVRKAAVERVEAELANARAELKRSEELRDGDFVSESHRDQWLLKVQVARAELNGARAEFERALVRSPVDGVVVKVHARAGERVGPKGILEVGRIDEMFAIAEVYETDIGGIRVGQRATVTSPVLSGPITGQVEWINLKVGKLDVLGSDPAARTDARVVEVEVRLDEGHLVSGLTNLQVEVEFEP